MAKTFTGAEFVKALTSGGLQRPIILIGMAKPAENDPAHILFSPAGCENWVRVPVELIESAEYHADAPCKDHNHPLVHIQLKEAAGKSPEGTILSALLGFWGRPGGSGYKPQPQPWRQTAKQKDPWPCTPDPDCIRECNETWAQGSNHLQICLDGCC